MNTENKRNGCKLCNVPIFIKVKQYTQPILAPITPAEATWDSWVNSTGMNFVRLTNRYCPACGRDLRGAHDHER